MRNTLALALLAALALPAFGQSITSQVCAEAGRESALCDMAHRLYNPARHYFDPKQHNGRRTAHIKLRRPWMDGWRFIFRPDQSQNLGGSYDYGGYEYNLVAADADAYGYAGLIVTVDEHERSMTICFADSSEDRQAALCRYDPDYCGGEPQPGPLVRAFEDTDGDGIYNYRYDLNLCDSRSFAAGQAKRRVEAALTCLETPEIRPLERPEGEYGPPFDIPCLGERRR